MTKTDGRRRVDPGAVEAAISDLIRALGLDAADEPELDRTPARLADLYREIFSGLDPSAEPDVAIIPRPPSAAREVVVVRDLPFYSLCVHHFVPFFGHAHVAYLPGDSLIGISGPARLLEHYSRRPQLQERIASQLSDHLERALRPRGVAVVLEARHLCMEMRGVRATGRVETRVMRGELADARWASLLPPAVGAHIDAHGS